MATKTLTQQLQDAHSEIASLRAKNSRLRAEKAALGTAYAYLQENIKVIGSKQKEYIRRSTARIRQLQNLKSENGLLREQNANLLDRVFTKL